jgi:hypothetical protein
MLVNFVESLLTKLRIKGQEEHTEKDEGSSNVANGFSGNIIVATMITANAGG